MRGSQTEGRGGEEGARGPGRIERYFKLTNSRIVAVNNYACAVGVRKARQTKCEREAESCSRRGKV